MGNINANNSNKYYNSNYSLLGDKELQNIRKYYKIIDVDWLDKDLANAEMFNNEYFQKNPNKKEIINNMLEYFLNSRDKKIYKMTDYLCNEKAKVCICNTHADDLRKIYERDLYKENVKYISWCKKEGDQY